MGKSQTNHFIVKRVEAWICSYNVEAANEEEVRRKFYEVEASCERDDSTVEPHEPYQVIEIEEPLTIDNVTEAELESLREVAA